MNEAATRSVGYLRNQRNPLKNVAADAGVVWVYEAPLMLLTDSSISAHRASSLAKTFAFSAVRA